MSLVIRSEARYLKSANGVFATILYQFALLTSQNRWLESEVVGMLFWHSLQKEAGQAPVIQGADVIQGKCLTRHQSALESEMVEKVYARIRTRVNLADTDRRLALLPCRCGARLRGE